MDRIPPVRPPFGGDPAPKDIEIGTERSGLPRVPDHELVRRIGRGSYGEVWLARNVLGRYRAVKIVDRSSFEQDHPFEREFSGIQKFEPVSRTHEGFVNILQVGRNEVAGYFYYVMELADNATTNRAANSMDGGSPHKNRGGDSSSPSAERATGGRAVPTPNAAAAETHTSEGSPLFDAATYVPKTLKSETRRRGRLPVDECLRLGFSLASALEHLHGHGLIHRDIKPSNVILVNGAPKLADIGLVAGLDATRSMVGTEGFMPPEGPGTPQADVFSLGKVLYELSMGKDRQDFPEPPTGLKVLPGYDQLIELNEVILKACDGDARKRYQSAREMRMDLALLLGGKSITRLRKIERRLALVTRVGPVALVGILLASGAYYQSVRAERKSRGRLVEVQVNNGVRSMDEGDLATSLLWFAEGLSFLDRGSRQQENHRLRFEAVRRQCPKLIQLSVHDGRVNAAEFSPDETRMMVASDAGTARVWDVRTGQPLTPPLPHRGTVWTASFSPDGRWVVTASSDTSARIWDAATGQPVGPALQHKGMVWLALFSPDGKRIVTASADHTARVWDVVTGQPVTPPLTHLVDVRSAVFSPDGNRILTASNDSAARVWDSTTGKLLLGPLQHGGAVRFAAFDLSGTRIVTASDDHTARVWDGATGKPITPPLKHLQEVRHAAFSPNGRMVATASWDNSAQVWDAATGERVAPPLRHDDHVRHVAFSPDGRWIATASVDHSARVWEARTGYPVTPPLKHNGSVCSAQFSVDGSMLLTASQDQTTRLWDLSDITTSSLVLRHGDKVGEAAFSPDGRWIATASRDGAVRLWDEITGNLVITIPARPLVDSAPHIRFSPVGSRFVTCIGDVAQIWRVPNAGKGTPTFQTLESSSYVIFSVFSPDGQRVVTLGTDHTARIWDAATAKPLTPPLQHRLNLLNATFSPNGRWLAVGTGQPDDWGEGEAQIWDTLTGRPAGPPIKHSGAVEQITFTADSKRILTACTDSSPDAKAAQIWDVTTGRRIGPPFRHNDGVGVASFSPNEKLVLTASEDMTARVWDAATGAPVTRPLRHREGISSAAFSPDGRRVVTSSRDHTARIWDAMTGEPLTPLLKHSASVVQAAFSPDGRRIVTASDDHTAQVWELPLCEWRLEDMKLLAALLTGQRIDRTGGFGAIESAELQRIWQILSSRHPSDFTRSQSEAAAWHKRQAESAEAENQWFTARFHWEWLLRAQPEDAVFRQRREAAHSKLFEQSTGK